MAAPRCPNCGERDWNDEGRCKACSGFPTLGYQIAQLIQAKCVVPDGDLTGKPYELTDEMLRFVLRLYRIHPATGKYVYERGAQLIRPQKWGKGPFAAAIVCAECDPEGPVKPDGFDANGDPVGRPWPTPHWQITAVAEDQTDNVWRALQAMIELGALAAEIPDTGLTRINLPGGGLIEPVSSSAQTRLGQRITGAVQDQTESWFGLGRQVADVQRRNLAGMGGRFLETANAWDPSQESVAQQTKREEGVYLDDVEPGKGSIRNKAERRKMLKRVYGDSWWVDLDRVESEIDALILRDPAQAERWFLNRKEASEARAFDIEAWDANADRMSQVEPGELIVIGIDGARLRDAFAAIATDVVTGHQWPLGIWERLENAPDDYEHPQDEIDGAISDAFERFEVWRAYCDDQWIEHLVKRWQGRWGEKRVVSWRTNRPGPIGWAVRNFTTAIGAGDQSHDGDPLLRRHIRSSYKQPLSVYDDERQQLYTLTKQYRGAKAKMDAAMAATLSWEARGDAIAAGARKTQRKTAAHFL